MGEEEGDDDPPLDLERLLDLSTDKNLSPGSSAGEEKEGNKVVLTDLDSHLETWCSHDLSSVREASWDLLAGGEEDMPYLLDSDIGSFNGLSVEACWDLMGDGDCDTPYLLDLDVSFDREMCWDLSSDGDGDMQYLLDLDFVGFNDLSFDHEACWGLSGEG